jgi:hypothetical protein
MERVAEMNKKEREREMMMGEWEDVREHLWDCE